MAQPQLIICVQKQGFRSSEILSSKTRTAESEHAACCVPGHRPSVTGTRGIFLNAVWTMCFSWWENSPTWVRNGVRFHTGLLRTEFTQKAWVEMLPAIESKTAQPGPLCMQASGKPRFPPERGQRAGSALASVRWINKNDFNKILTFDKNVSCPNIAIEMVHPHSELFSC